MAGRLARVVGRIESDGPVTHVIAERVEDVSHLLATLGRPVIIDANDGRADETKRPVGGSRRRHLGVTINDPNSESSAVAQSASTSRTAQSENLTAEAFNCGT
jgi:hypothetical protein